MEHLDVTLGGVQGAQPVHGATTIGSFSMTNDTDVLTPPSGKRYRVLAYMLEVTGNAGIAVAGSLTIGLGGAITHNMYADTGATPQLGLIYSTGWVPLGPNGLVGATDAVFAAAFNVALTAGAATLVLAYLFETPPIA